MKEKKLKFTFLLLFFLLNLKLSSCFIGDFQTYVSFGMNFMDKFTKTIRAVQGENVTEEFEANMWGDRTQSYLESIVGKVDRISTALNVMTKKMSQKLDVLTEMLNEMPDMVNRQQLMNEFSRNSDRITLAYKTLQIYTSGKEKVTRKRIERFIDDNIASQEKAGLEGILGDIASIIISPVNPENLLTVMERMEKKKYKKAACGRSPPHLILYEFYLTIAGLEMLAMSSLASGYGLREFLDPAQEAIPEVEFLQKRMSERMVNYAIKFSETMTRLYHSHRNCDPAEPERDVTFVEMWGLHGLVTLNEYGIMLQNTAYCGRGCGALNNLRPDNKWCHAKPSAWTAVIDGRPEDVKQCTTDRMCMGKLKNCWATAEIKYCIKKNSTRRYEWISDTHMKAVTTYIGDDDIINYKYADTFMRGKKSDCDEKGELLEHWSYHVRRIGKKRQLCQYCFCICDDHEVDSISVNTVSLKPARSDTAKNKVVVGARFVVFDNILQIQIQEGVVIKDYYLSAKKKNWVELPKMKDDVYQSRKNPDNAKLKIDVDFTVITNQHAFNLDEIQLPLGQLLTGIKFGVIDASNGGFAKRLQIEIESMEYDHETGKLKQGSEEWTKPEPVDHDSQHKFSKKSPLNAKTAPIVGKEPNQFVVLSESDLDDVSQTVVPLFDAQSIESLPNTPLIGLGLNHRGTKNSSGYLEFTAYTANFGKFLASTLKEFAQDEEAEDTEDFEY